jgi:hypothetical protein
MVKKLPVPGGWQQEARGNPEVVLRFGGERKQRRRGLSEEDFLEWRPSLRQGYLSGRIDKLTAGTEAEARSLGRARGSGTRVHENMPRAPAEETKMNGLARMTRSSRSRSRGDG